jgi:hypothetical protein
VKAACSKPDKFKKSTRAYTLHKSKEENLKEWKERWHDLDTHMSENTTGTSTSLKTAHAHVAKHTKPDYTY